MKMPGKVFRCGVHGLVLLVGNFAGILIGSAVYNALKPIDQIAVQVPIAVVLSIGGFGVWSLLFRKGRFALQGSGELVGTFAASLVWGPAVFVVFHYFSQGYLTGSGNIVALLIFQLPVNAIAILAASKFSQRIEGDDLEGGLSST